MESTILVMGQLSSLMCPFANLALNQFAARQVRVKVKTQSKKVNKSWLNDHVNDPYVKQAKVDGFRARAAYKLKEIDETFKLIKPGHVVVDLGSTPGAWSQYVRRRLSPTGAAVGTLNGVIIALDILPMEPIEGVDFIQGDFTEQLTLDALLSKVKLLTQSKKALEPDLAGETISPDGTAANSRVVDVVVSDIAPNLSGIADTDAARIELLIELAVDFAQTQLKPEGALVVKLFHGGAYEPIVKLFRRTFKTVKSCKPKASRDKSSETFLVGMGLKSLVASA
jgi:23S rRNA (uridine2552-2'-O)-methyltransferase